MSVSDAPPGFPTFDGFMGNPMPFPFPPNMGMGPHSGPMVKVGGFQVTMNSNGSTTVVPLSPQMLPPPEVVKRIMQVSHTTTATTCYSRRVDC